METVGRGGGGSMKTMNVNNEISSNKIYKAILKQNSCGHNFLEYNKNYYFFMYTNTLGLKEI